MSFSDGSDTEEYSMDESEKQDTSSDILTDIDKKIVIKYLKDDRAHRTHIIGLNLFFEDEKEEKQIAKSIQKKLSTGYYYHSDKNSHSYNGDHRIKINNILIKDYNLPKEKINVH